MADQGTMRYLETELVGLAVSASPHADHLRESLDGDQIDAMATRMTNVFETLAGAGLIGAEPRPIDQSGRYDSVLYGRQGGSTVIAYSFAGLVFDAAIPLFSAAIAFFTRTAGPGNAGDAASLVAALWNNFALLREPADGDAIAVIRATIAVRTQGSNFSIDHLPASTEVAQAAGFDLPRTVAALRTLSERRILSVAIWGSQRDDLDDPGNRWCFRV
jgi:hypothetical protein